MIVKNISEAKAELSALIEAVGRGEEVLIGKAGVPVAKLIPYRGIGEVRTPGKIKMKLQMAADFDELPAEIAEAFGVVK